MPPPHLRCPLCSALLPPSALEAHLRCELGYAAFRCLLCPLAFFAQPDAVAHFRGELARHPDQPVAIAEARDEAKHRQLAELVRTAQGAEARPTCACGRCICGGRAPAEAPKPPPLLLPPPSMASMVAPPQAVSPMDASEPEDQPRQPSPQDDLPQEAPEPEAKPQMALVKTELAPASEAKSEVGADGRLACRQCDLRVTTDRLSVHALSHAKDRPFNCTVCPFDAWTKAEVSKHVRKEHGVAPSAETLTMTLSEEAAAGLREACFGVVDDQRRAKAPCGQCGKAVDVSQVKDHVAQHHLRKVVHSCLRCDFTSVFYTAGHIKKHIAKAHRETPGPKNWENEAEKILPVIKNMVAKLFPKP